MSNLEGYCAVYRPTIWNRLGFGRRSAFFDEEVEGFAEGHVTVNTTCHLDWKDRLRVLLSGRLFVSAAVKTDVIVNKSLATSVCSVLAPGDKNHG